MLVLAVWVQFLYFSHSEPHIQTSAHPTEGSPPGQDWWLMALSPLKGAITEAQCH